MEEKWEVMKKRHLEKKRAEQGGNLDLDKYTEEEREDYFQDALEFP